MGYELLLVVSIWALCCLLIVKITQNAKLIKASIDESVWTSYMLEKDNQIKVNDIYIAELKKTVNELEQEVDSCNSTILYQANERNGMCKTCTYRNLSTSKVDRFGKITSDTHAEH